MDGNTEEENCAWPFKNCKKLIILDHDKQGET